MKVIIAGSRDFNDYELLKQKCDHILSLQKEVEIVSGGARGADQLGEKYAQEKGYSVKQFIPNWQMLQKKAGFIRNIDMAIYTDALIAFWDGKSKGTHHMISVAMERKLKLTIIRYDKN